MRHRCAQIIQYNLHYNVSGYLTPLCKILFLIYVCTADISHGLLVFRTKSNYCNLCSLLCAWKFKASVKWRGVYYTLTDTCRGNVTIQQLIYTVCKCSRWPIHSGKVAVTVTCYTYLHFLHLPTQSQSTSCKLILLSYTLTLLCTLFRYICILL